MTLQNGNCINIRFFCFCFWVGYPGFDSDLEVMLLEYLRLIAASSKLCSKYGKGQRTTKSGTG